MTFGLTFPYCLGKVKVMIFFDTFCFLPIGSILPLWAIEMTFPSSFYSPLLLNVPFAVVIILLLSHHFLLYKSPEICFPNRANISWCFVVFMIDHIWLVSLDTFVSKFGPKLFAAIQSQHLRLYNQNMIISLSVRTLSAINGNQNEK